MHAGWAWLSSPLSALATLIAICAVALVIASVSLAAAAVAERAATDTTDRFAGARRPMPSTNSGTLAQQDERGILDYLLGGRSSGSTPAPGPSAVSSKPIVRVALVIGVSGYKTAGVLKNTLNDAGDIAAILRTLDFDVVTAFDPDKRGIEVAIRDFTRKLKGAAVGLFFYAGHGIQVGNINYLLGTDAKLEIVGDLAFEGVKIDFVLEQMERETKTNLVFLDACRNNPLARNLARTMGTRAVNEAGGLAQINAGLGTFIAYATQPGNVALDGDGRNSPFTAALKTHITRPGLSLSELMIEVRREVRDKTGASQIPWDASSMDHTFYFKPVAPVASAAAVPAASTPNLQSTASPQKSADATKIVADHPPQPQTPPASSQLPPAPAPQPAAGSKPALAALDEMQARPPPAPPPPPRPKAAGPCTLTARHIGTDDAGRATFSVASSCGAIDEIAIRYREWTFRRRPRQPAAQVEVVFDLFAGPGSLTFEVANAGQASAQATLPGAANLIKVALVWQSPVDLDLHALQFSARRGEAGHLWQSAPGALSLASQGQTGFISFSDDGSLPDHHVEVYTFIKTLSHRHGGVQFIVDHKSRGARPAAEFCGTGAFAGVPFSLLQFENGQLGAQPIRSFISRQPCGEELSERARYGQAMLTLKF